MTDVNLDRSRMLRTNGLGIMPGKPTTLDRQALVSTKGLSAAIGKPQN